jgi:hypothetical protein
LQRQGVPSSAQQFVLPIVTASMRGAGLPERTQSSHDTQKTDEVRKLQGHAGGHAPLVSFPSVKDGKGILMGTATSESLVHSCLASPLPHPKSSPLRDSASDTLSPHAICDIRLPPMYST